MSSAATSELTDGGAAVTKLSFSFSRASGGKIPRKGVYFTGKEAKGAMKEKGSRGGGGGGAGKGGWEGEKGRGKGGWKGGRKKKSSLNDGFDNDTSANFVPWKKRTYTKMNNKVTQQDAVYTQPDQKLRGTSTCFAQTETSAGLHHHLLHFLVQIKI